MSTPDYGTRDRIYVHYPDSESGESLNRWHEVLREQTTTEGTTMTDLTRDVTRVDVGKERIEVTARGQRITARHSAESGRGWAIGEVERVEVLEAVNP